MKLDIYRNQVATLTNYAVGTLKENAVMIAASYARTPEELGRSWRERHGPW
ncbi:hypothetical protein AB4072_06885 [Microvirga sp. 2MCAF38]|uniref:hypothetical protein n=1 Tax=Microvirga sp. 2MCAF38 TaxID=3232989 RepID=UPI003F99F080